MDGRCEGCGAETDELADGHCYSCSNPDLAERPRLLDQMRELFGGIVTGISRLLGRGEDEVLLGVTRAEEKLVVARRPDPGKN